MEVCAEGTHFLVLNELLFMILFLAEDPSEDLFHFVVIKGFGDGKLEFFYFLKDFTEVRLN